MTETNTTTALGPIWEKHHASSPQILHSLQKDGLNAFTASGFPTTRNESWKYTDIRRLADAYPLWLATQPNGTAQQTGSDLDLGTAITIRFIDGVCTSPSETMGMLAEGAAIGTLADFARHDPERLEKRLGALARPDDSGLIALNSAFAGQGLMLVVPDNVQLQTPVYIHYHSATAQINSQPRLLIELGENSSAIVIEHFSSDGPSITNAVAESVCGDGAQLSYYRLQDEHQDAWHTGAQYFELARDATVRTTHLDMGASIARNQIQINLSGRGAHAEATGLFMADASRHIDSRIEVNHIAPATTSRERFRSVLGDRARGVFNGRIHVHREAQKTAAELTNRNLLLNAGAEINTKPELEIYADDVKCAHGSTTGQLDETSLFYLKTRGITTDIARNMLITAFVSELLTDIPYPAMVKRAQQALDDLRPEQSELPL